MTRNSVPPEQRAEIAARRAARKRARRADKARRSAAIDAAWLAHMWAPTPAEAAAEAEPAASAPADIPATPDAATVEWPDDLPKPGPGRRFPSARAIAKWLGVPVRQYDPHELTALITAWATAAREAGLPVNVSTANGRTLPRSLGRPQRPSRPATGRDS